MFIGAPDVGALTSLILALLVVLEIYIEYQFCYSIYTYLVKDLLEEPSPATYRHWRETVAHSRGFMDANMTSLVERICALDDSVSVGGSQFEMLQIIDDYLEGSGGLMICCLSLLLWVLTSRRTCARTSRCATPSTTRARPCRTSRARAAASDALCAIRAGIQRRAALHRLDVARANAGDREPRAQSAALGFVLELSDLLLAVMPVTFVHRVAEQPPLKLALGDCPFDTAVTAAGVVVVLLVAMGACAIPPRATRAVRGRARGEISDRRCDCEGRNFVAGANAEVGLQYANGNAAVRRGRAQVVFLQRGDPRAHPLRLRRRVALTRQHRRRCACTTCVSPRARRTRPTRAPRRPPTRARAKMFTHAHTRTRAPNQFVPPRDRPMPPAHVPLVLRRETTSVGRTL